MDTPAAVAAKKSQERLMMFAVVIAVLVAAGIFVYQFTRETKSAYSYQRQPWDL